MDSLPVELLRLVFRCCDAADVRNLRLVSGTLAEVGYDYLVPPEFTALPWRDDVARLHAIAGHSRLRGSVESVLLNFTEVDEYNTRHATWFQHYLQEPEERNEVLQNAWTQYYEAEKSRKAVPPFTSRPAMVQEAFAQLPNLKSLRVTYTETPVDIEVLEHVFQSQPNCRKMDRLQACKNLGLVVSALKETELASLSIDRFPLEILRMPDDRKLWFESSPDAFAHLSSLSLTVDPSSLIFPASRNKAIIGLGHIICFAPNLTSLSLAFHAYGAPRSKFILWFGTLFEDFTFTKLTDLKLEGICCDEEDLRDFLARHGDTLQRLRLGGRGLAKAFEGSLGGIHLCRGTFKSLFTSLRPRLPKLESFHMEGDFECAAPESAHESYTFHAVTDDNWVGVQRTRRLAGTSKTRDCLDFERYLLHGGKYPEAAVIEAQ